MKGVYIFLSDGFEDMEALSTYDVLRRAGVAVQLVSIADEPFVRSSHGLTVGVEYCLDDLLESASQEGTTHRDFMIFPGGMPGSRNLASCRKLIALMKRHYAEGGSLAAICAAPGLVLGQLDSLEGIQFTCFDSFEQQPVLKGALFLRKPAVRSGRIITGRSAGYALDFAYEILEAVCGAETVEKVRSGVSLECE